MRLFVLTVVSVCLSTLGLHASGNPELTAGQREILALHQSMAAALQNRDLTEWAKFVADNCIFSSDDGELTTKAQIVENMKTLAPAYDRSENHRDFLVRIYGDTAVLNFRLTAHEQFTDTDIVTEMRHTQTFAKQNGQWRLVAEQWGALPINFRKPVAADRSAFQEYVGRYEWRPGGPVDNVAFKNGKLLARLTKEAEDHEYQPLGSETFFLADDLGTVKFVRDAQGHVSGYTYRRADGQEIHVKKMK